MKRLIYLLLYGFCFSILLSNAQSTNATLSGGVTDPAGTFIVGAEIDIANDTTGVVYTTKTNSSGIYYLSILPPGHYHVQVSKIGFKTLIKPDVVLNVQSALSLNFSLPIGATSESITVDAPSSLLNTTNASVSTVVDRKFVENMPLNGRSFQDLISMTPGVVTQSPQSSSTLGGNGDFSVNGQRTESNYYTVDGVSANFGAGVGDGSPGAATGGAIPGSTALGTTQSLISVDALQEFRVSSSTYSAEYGRSPGGQFSLVTRSGTNIFHGTAFNYLRNNFFDANDWFNDHYGIQQPALRQNDFGGTLGGPVSIPRLYSGHDRSFFFASYEGLRLTQPQAATVQYVPDTALRQQAPAVLQPILNAFPSPAPDGIDYASASLAQFIDAYSLPAQINSVTSRFDQTITPKLAIFFRFGYTPSFTQSRNLSAVTEQHQNSQTYTLGATSQLSSRINNEAHLGYSRSDAIQQQTLDNFGGALPTNFSNALTVGSANNNTNLWELFIPGVGYTYLQTLDTRNSSDQWNVTDTLSISFGHQQLKFGIDYRRIKSPTAPAPASVEVVYEAASQVLNNNAYYADLLRQQSATPIFNEFAAFAEDEWRISPGISLSLGTRWEVNPPPTEAHGNDAFTILGNLSDPASVTVAPRGTPLWKTPWLNFAPRLGVAWTAHNSPGRETVVRTGAGAFFDTDNQLAASGFYGLGFTAQALDFGVSLPLPSSAIAFPISASAPYTNSFIFAFPQHLQLPYDLQWNVSLDQALGKSQAVTISYVGSNGRRLAQQQQFAYGSLNSEFGTILYATGNITSNYQALQVKFQRSISHGLQALASYTWSHSIDYGSSYTGTPLERADSDFDVRHNLQAALSWDIPFAGQNRIAKAVADNWGLDGRVNVRSAFPIFIYGNYLTDPGTGSQYYSTVNAVPNVPQFVHGSQYPGGRALNPEAFSLPNGTAYGDLPRNSDRGFGATQLNVAARRTFPLHKSIALQFRAEAFNFLNHPNLGYIDSYYTDATFGQATKMLNQSLGTMASQYQQGGPRSMQFALKILF